MLSDTGTTEKLFEYAIELERAAETLYRQLGKMFAHLPEVALFWKRYADEEKGHALYLERIRDGVDAARLARQADSDMFVKVQQWLNKSSRTGLEGIKTLEDAFQVAVELENSETNAIFEFIVMNFSTDELAKSHNFLRTQLNTHIARLENDFPNPYKSRTTRQNILAVK